jgi:hypothetical protein
MRHADSSPGRLPGEWITAIKAAQQPTVPEPYVSVARVRRREDAPSETFEHALELRSLIGGLKRERIRKGLTLSDVSRLSQQARSALSRLESGEYANPTLNTLYRYARALGWHIKFCAEPIADAAGMDVTEAKPPGR